MTSSTKFDFADSKANNRYANLIKVYSDSWRSSMSTSATAVAIHNSIPNVKHVAYVRCKSGSTTIRVKLFDGSTVTLHTYEVNAEDNVRYSWHAEVAAKSDEVTLH